MEALLNKRPKSYGETGNSIIFESLTDFWSSSGISTVFPIRATFTDQISQFLQKLDHIEQLGNNWNGYGADTPSKSAIQNTRQFITENSEISLPFYFIAPGVNGEIMLEFSKDEKAAELFFLDDGTTELLLFENDNTILEGTLENHFSDLINFFNE